jgi:tetratricopeptide (TPR) repeat protein
LEEEFIYDLKNKLSSKNYRSRKRLNKVDVVASVCRVCIDKRDPNELTEAINSMFRWYRGAAKCYVYLSDVSTSAEDPKMCQSAWEAEFRSSIWFTRGWTLQELLAPSSVIFYSSDHKELGDMKFLARAIHETTGISLLALDGQPMNTFSVAERMGWAAKRQTTKGEDGAYCLLGIFGIFLPLIYGEGREHALKRLEKEVNDSFKKGKALYFCLGSKLNFHAEESIPFIVPFDQNAQFIGRNTLLTEVEEKLIIGQQTKQVAITGLGGIGKSQLTLELAYRTRQRCTDCAVFWIPATDLENLHQAYTVIAQRLKLLDSEEKKTDVKRFVQLHLSSEDAGQWLLIFDNVDDSSLWLTRPDGSQTGTVDLIDYLPRSGQGRIIFTTRDRKAAVKLASRDIIDMPDVDPQTARQMLEKYLINPDLTTDLDVTDRLLEELAYLPLAIVQAAAYINANNIQLDGYLSLLAEQEEEIIDLLSEDFEDKSRYRNVRNSVATTWLISFDQIRRRDMLAAEYLSFMACIDRKDIPQSLLPGGPSRKKEIDAIGTLDAYAFITKRPAESAVDLHRLVHLVTRNWLRRQSLLGHWTQVAVQRLLAQFPDDDPKNRDLWRALLPHATYALASRIAGLNNKEEADLSWKCAESLYSDGRYNEAEVYFNEAVQTNEKVLGADHPDTLTSIANLASTYWDQGRWKEAEELEVQVMETRKTKLGADHPDTLTSMHNLAFTLKAQGRDIAAIELLAECVQLQTHNLDANHPSAVSSIETLNVWRLENVDMS